MSGNVSSDIRLAQRMLRIAEGQFARAKRQLRNAKLKSEAIMRINRLGTNPNVIDGFYSNDGVVVYSAELDMFFSWIRRKGHNSQT